MVTSGLPSDFTLDLCPVRLTSFNPSARPIMFVLCSAVARLVSCIVDELARGQTKPGRNLLLQWTSLLFLPLNEVNALRP